MMVKHDRIQGSYDCSEPASLVLMIYEDLVEVGFDLVIISSW